MTGVLTCALPIFGLIPLAVLFVIQRTFYAYNDTRTPFFFTVLQCAIVVATALVAQATLSLDFLAAGVALGQSFASIVQVILATWLLERRLGGIAVGSWLLSLARFIVAAIPAAAVGWLVFLWFGGADGWTASSPLLGAVGAAIIGLVSIAVYVGLLALLRAPELSVATGLVRRFLPGRR